MTLLWINIHASNASSHNFQLELTSRIWYLTSINSGKEATNEANHGQVRLSSWNRWRKLRLETKVAWTRPAESSTKMWRTASPAPRQARPPTCAVPHEAPLGFVDLRGTGPGDNFALIRSSGSGQGLPIGDWGGMESSPHPHPTSWIAWLPI